MGSQRAAARGDGGREARGGTAQLCVGIVHLFFEGLLSKVVVAWSRSRKRSAARGCSRRCASRSRSRCASDRAACYFLRRSYSCIRSLVVLSRSPQLLHNFLSSFQLYIVLVLIAFCHLLLPLLFFLAVRRPGSDRTVAFISL